MGRKPHATVRLALSLLGTAAIAEYDSFQMLLLRSEIGVDIPGPAAGLELGSPGRRRCVRPGR